MAKTSVAMAERGPDGYGQPMRWRGEAQHRDGKAERSQGNGMAATGDAMARRGVDWYCTGKVVIRSARAKPRTAVEKLGSPQLGRSSGWRRVVKQRPSGGWCRVARQRRSSETVR